MQGVAFGPGTAPRLFSGLLGRHRLSSSWSTGLLTDGPPIEKFALRGPAFVLAGHRRLRGHDARHRRAAARPRALRLRSLHDLDLRLARDALGREPDRGGGDDAILRRAVFYVLNLPFQLWPRSCKGQGRMFDLFHNLALGFSVAAQPTNIGFCLIGALVGTLIGVLPGIGPLATIAMLLPITFGLPPVGALIMLAGIYYGAQYGGSTTSILVNIPGEASSVVTCLDGHQMARQGRAGPALAIAAIGSFFAGCVATVLVAALGAPLTSVALLFGPAEYFSLMVLGLIFAVVLAKGSVLKAHRHDPDRACCCRWSAPTSRPAPGA